MENNQAAPSAAAPVFWTKEMAKDLQILADYCSAVSTASLQREAVLSFFGPRNQETLSNSNAQSPLHLEDVSASPPADVLVLFGGSIMQGMEYFKEGLDQKVAQTSVIVGGYGHTTAALQKQMKPMLHTIYPTEAETFQAALLLQGYAADLLETRSTNCGNNITYLLDLLEAHQLPYERMIFIQDASMEKRMEATLLKYKPEVQVLHCPSSRTTFEAENGCLQLLDAPPGMWKAEKFASLLMGELQRMQDNEEGYGPRGKDFIAHLDIPEEVLAAYTRLLQQAPHLVRTANPAYAG